MISNPDAIAVSQDALGAQARRVAVFAPSNATLGQAGSDNVAVIGVCNASRPTQVWRWVDSNVSGPINQLLMLPCNASDPYQQWTYDLNAMGLTRTPHAAHVCAGWLRGGRGEGSGVWLGGRTVHPLLRVWRVHLLSLWVSGG